MSAVAPSVLRWRAPTLNVDGTPITYPLDYELGVAPPQGVMVPVAVIVGTLQEGGLYEAPLDQVSFPEGVSTVALRAVRRDRPDVMSAWSNTLEVTAVAVPNPPVLVPAHGE